MERKEGLIPAMPDSQLTASGNNLQIPNQPHVDGISTCPTKNPIVCISSMNNGNNSFTYVPNTSTQGNEVPSQKTEMPSLMNSGVCEDVRLLEAAKGGLTDIILHLIEDEGQQLHHHRDKVRIYLNGINSYMY